LPLFLAPVYRDVKPTLQKNEEKFTLAAKILAKHNPNGPKACINPDTLKTLLAAKPVILAE
jgi:hypothetical protein